MATLAPSVARRLAIAAPIPREPPVTSATFSANLDMASPVNFVHRTAGQSRGLPRTLKRLYKLGAYSAGMGKSDGAAAPTIFHRRRRDGESHGGGRQATSYLAAVAQPPDPRPGI